MTDAVEDDIVAPDLLLDAVVDLLVAHWPRSYY